MMTIASAVSLVWVSETCIWYSPSILESARVFIEPVSFIMGLPDISFPMTDSFQRKPLRMPVPSALERASFAAKRAAKCSAVFLRELQ